MKIKKILLAIIIYQALFSYNKKENNNIVKFDNDKELKKSPNLDPINLFLKYYSNDGESFNNYNFI